MRNKIRIPVIFILIFALAFSFGACGKNSDNAETVSETYATEETTGPSEGVSTVTEGKVLVAYFSATGNTKPVAMYAAEILGADLYEIVPADPYTDDDLNYSDSSSRATKEQNDPSARPEISGTVENMDQYDTVIIAYPIWWGKEPKIIDTFMESYDFSGKTLTSCCTSGGSGIEMSASDLKEMSPNADWLESRRFEIGPDKNAVEDWLFEIGLK